MLSPDFYAEGNNGGDNIQIKKIGEGELRLKVGHCCVYVMNVVVPVEFITAALTKAVDDAGGPIELLRQAGWDKDYTETLVAKVKIE